MVPKDKSSLLPMVSPPPLFAVKLGVFCLRLFEASYATEADALLSFILCSCCQGSFPDMASCVLCCLERTVEGSKGIHTL